MTAGQSPGRSTHWFPRLWKPVTFSFPPLLLWLVLELCVCQPPPAAWCGGAGIITTYPGYLHFHLCNHKMSLINIWWLVTRKYRIMKSEVINTLHVYELGYSKHTKPFWWFNLETALVLIMAVNAYIETSILPFSYFLIFFMKPKVWLYGPQSQTARIQM